MGKPVKLNRAQLRSIIKEEADRASHHSIGNELTSALLQLIEEHGSELLEHLLGLTDDATDRPVRYEDAEWFAKSAVEHTLKQYELHEALVSVAEQAIKELMESE